MRSWIAVSTSLTLDVVSAQAVGDGYRCRGLLNAL
jgi:hypothetical protein